MVKPIDRAGVDVQDGPAHWHSRDKRTSRRIVVKDRGLIVALQPVAEPPQATIRGYLVNVSGGGCCLAAAAGLVEGLTPGLHCTVDLPVGKQRVSQPATLVSIEREREAPAEVLLRLRFRKADSLTQQQVTRWIGELAIQTWRSQ
jgi:c-di-GMP-binding flagellar brake protein YcgR